MQTSEMRGLQSLVSPPSSVLRRSLSLSSFWIVKTMSYPCRPSQMLLRLPGPQNRSRVPRWFPSTLRPELLLQRFCRERYLQVTSPNRSSFLTTSRECTSKYQSKCQLDWRVFGSYVPKISGFIIISLNVCFSH